MRNLSRGSLVTYLLTACSFPLQHITGKVLGKLILIFIYCLLPINAICWEIDTLTELSQLDF